MYSRIIKNKSLIGVPKFGFKNKVVLKPDNLEIRKQINYLKVTLRNEDINLKTKSFYFDNNTSLDSIVSKMESEYDLQILLGDELKNQFETILKKSNSFKQEADGEMVTKILEIADSLKIEKNQVPKFLSEILSSKTDQLTHLKILHFDVSQEISRMEKLKKRINETGSRRATIILFILLAALIFQTGLYYHLIFNVEHLGWDLMEPTTYLISSVLFLLGVMSYVKLQRNAISGERILQNFSKGFYLKRSVRDNFNNEKYQVLKRRKELITREIESFKH